MANILYLLVYTYIPSNHRGLLLLRLQGGYSLFKIIFGDMIIVLANKSVTTRSFTLLSVSVITSSLNDY